MIIKVFGGIDFYADILNSLAALFFGPKGSTGEHWAQFLKTLGGVSGLTAAAMLYFKTYKPVHLGRFLAMLIFAEALFLSPTKVNLKDEISGDVRTVDNVPWIVGFLGSTTTSMSFSLTEMLETLFQIPDETKFHKSGMALYATLLAESTQISIKDPLLKRNMDDFIGQCVVHTAMIGQKYTIKDLQESSDLWGLISQNASPILGLYIHQAGGQSTYMSCADAAKTLTGKWNDETQSAIAYLERLILPNSGSRPPVENQLNQVARQSIDAKLNDTYDLLQVFKVGASDSAAAIRQQMTINALVSGVQNKLSVLDAGENYALSKAMLQQQDTWNLTGKMAVRTLPQIKNVIECILWIFSILIFVLLFMPSGFKTLGIYVQMLVWVNLWAPFYAILNLFIATGTKLRIASALGTQGITLGNIQDVASISSSMASAAEYLTLSIPVMAWALLKGGTYSLGQMVQIAGATAQSASGSVAAEMAGGNYSHGNISMNDISHDNVNAFQQMTAPSFHSTGMSMVDQSGTKWTEYGSGAMVADTSASMSQLPVNASLSEGLEKAAHSNLNQAQSMMASSQKEFSSAISDVGRTGAEFSNAIGFTDAKSLQENSGITYSSAEQLSKTFELADSIQERTGLSRERSVSLAAQASVGASFAGLLKAELSSIGQTSAQADSAVAELSDQVNRLGITESSDKTIRALQEFSENKSGTQEGRMANSLASSLERASIARESLMTSEQRVNSAEKALSYIQNSGVSLEHNRNQAFLDFVAHQNENGKAIGYDRAVAKMRLGGAHIAPYAEAFAHHEFNHIQSSVGLDNVPDQSAQLSMPSLSMQNYEALVNKGDNLALIHENITSSAKGVLQQNEALAPTKDMQSFNEIQQQQDYELQQQKLLMRDTGQHQQNRVTQFKSDGVLMHAGKEALVVGIDSITDTADMVANVASKGIDSRVVQGGMAPLGGTPGKK